MRHFKFTWNRVSAPGKSGLTSLRKRYFHQLCTLLSILQHCYEIKAQGLIQIIQIKFLIDLIFQITCALAWGLPNKPTYPELELMETYENGTLPFLLRKDKNVTDPNRKGEIKLSTSPSNATVHNMPNSTYANNDYKRNEFMNRIANYYKYFQRRKPDSYYFGNSPLNPANHNKMSNCNGRICAFNNHSTYYTNNKNSNGYNSYNVRPPYSVTYDRGNQYDAFTQYINETYLKGWLDSASQPKSTTITPKSS